MTDDNVQSEQNAENVSSQPEGGSAPPQPIAASSPPAKKPRSSTERLIVWGGIGVLLLVVAVEGHARLAYKWTRSSLIAALENDEQGEVVQVAQLDGLLKGFVNKSEVVKENNDFFVNCEWKSLFRPGQYQIKIQVSSDQSNAVVFGFTTFDPEPEPVRKSIPTGDEDEDEVDENDGEEDDESGEAPTANAESTSAKEE